MHYDIQDLLQMELEPVGIFYCDEAPQDALTLRSDRRNCVADMLMGAARGKTIVMTEETCSCAGGAVGLGFGDAFTQRNHPTRYLLSTGMAQVPEGEEVKLPPHMQEGERFFADPCVTDVWRSSLPFGDYQGKQVVFAPAKDWPETTSFKETVPSKNDHHEGDGRKKNGSGVCKNNFPELVCLFVNPDQLSALVSMAGFRSGNRLETIAPFGAACHSIIYALDQAKSENPKMVLGYFDVSQRAKIPANLLTVTLPYSLFVRFEEDAHKGCLSSHAWVDLMKKRARQTQ